MTVMFLLLGTSLRQHSVALPLETSLSENQISQAIVAVQPKGKQTPHNSTIQQNKGFFEDLKEDVEDVQNDVVETGEDVQNDVVETGEDAKNNAVETGEDVQNDVVETGEDAKNDVVERE
ncbi:hypothetical protein H1P_3920006 [Hyella patelloides LEGE 07179]|uniref:Uncharacterized protein n=1 Tax=Hyella patelloides LEGE 07179 TaxID=945734 RepID=A0A563VWZ4_9CYAN|nr:YtxH domain-containing protein [Hyella patelloides]VEP15978.1 hypothetical protein H1P_3920006 [Hyella patelloides LEGE 07179]